MVLSTHNGDSTWNRPVIDAGWQVDTFSWCLSNGLYFSGWTGEGVACLVAPAWMRTELRREKAQPHNTILTCFFNFDWQILLELYTSNTNIYILILYLLHCSVALAVSYWLQSSTEIYREVYRKSTKTHPYVEFWKDHMVNKALDIALIKPKLLPQARTHVTIGWA